MINIYIINIIDTYISTSLDSFGLSVAPPTQSRS